MLSEIKNGIMILIFHTIKNPINIFHSFQKVD